MDSFNASSVYNLPPCSGAPCSGVNMADGSVMAGSAMVGSPVVGTAMAGAPMGGYTMGSSAVPTIQDIAGYSYLSPQQQQQQKEQLGQVGSRPFSGNPRQQASTSTGTMMLPSSATSTGSMIAPATPGTPPTTISADSLQYMNGFLRSQIGRPVTVDFLIGTNTLVDKTGTLLGVGVNYILINETGTDDVIACDFYNIKFVKFYY